MAAVPKPSQAKVAKAPRVKAEKVAKNPEDMPLCLCGCGERTKGGRFRPGHDARYHSAQKKAAAGEAEAK